MPPASSGLNFQYIDVPFVGGLDLKTAKTQVPAGKLLSAVNAIFIKKGKIQTRNGSLALTGPNGVSAINWIGQFQDELLVSGGPVLGQEFSQYSYSPELGSGTWLQKGSLQPIGLSSGTVVANIYDHPAVDVTVVLDMAVYVYEENGGIYSTVVDLSTGATIVEDQQLSAFSDGVGNTPRVITVGTTAYVFWRGSSIGQLGNLFYATYDATTGAFTLGNSYIQIFAPGAVDVSNTVVYEARNVSGTGPVLTWVHTTNAAYITTFTAGGGAGTAVRINSANSTFNTATFIGTWYFSSSSRYLVVVANTTSYFFIWLNASFSNTTTWTVLLTGNANSTGKATSALKFVGTTYYLLTELAVTTLGTTSNLLIQTSLTVDSSTIGTQVTEQRSVTLAGDAFVQGGELYVPVVYSSNIEPTYFLLQFGDSNGIVAKFAPSTAGGALLRPKCPTVFPTTTNRWLIPIQTLTQGSGNYDQVQTTIRAVTGLDFQFGVQMTSAAIGYNLNVTGGFLAAYDSAAFVEENFHLFPESPIVLGSPVGVIRQTVGSGGTSFSGSVAEVTWITIPAPTRKPDGTVYGSGWMIQPGSYFVFFSQVDGTGSGGDNINEPFYVWFSVDGIGTSPGLSGFTGYQCSVASTDTDLTICSKIAAVITSPLFSVSVRGPAGAQTKPSVGACVLSIQNNNSTAASNPVASPIPSAWSDNCVFAPGSGAQGSVAMQNLGAVPASPGTTFSATLNGSVVPNSLIVYQQPAGGSTPFQMAVDSGVEIASGPPTQFGLIETDGQGLLNTTVAGAATYVTYEGDASHASVLTLGFYNAVSATIFATYSFNYLVTQGTTTNFIFPAGNRILPGGFFLVPDYNGASGAAGTATLFYFTVDGQGAAPSTLVKAQVYPGGISGTQAIAVSSTLTAVQVATAVQAVLTNAGSPGYNTKWHANSQPNSISIQITWPVGFSGTYVEAFNYNLSGNLADGNYYAQNGGAQPGQDSGQFSIWQYEVTYEQYDARGQVNRSAPSIPAYCIVNCVGNTYQYSGGANAGSTINVGGILPRLSIQCLDITDKTNISVVVYRSLVNPTAGIFYRSSAPVYQTSTVAVPQGPIQNQIVLWVANTQYNIGVRVVGQVSGIAYAFQAISAGVSGGSVPSWSTSGGSPITDGAVNWVYAGNPDFASYFDSNTDAVIQTNPLLYTDGGVLAYNSPPAPSFTTTHRGRNWVIPWETPNNLWYSQTLIQGGQIAPGFNSLLTQAIPQEGGPCTALQSMDEKLVIFTAGRIYVMQGDGPTPTGTNSNFTPPDLISTEAGCISPYSVILTSEGVWFQSAKGIYLLGRDLSVSYIGAPVEDLVTGNLVTSAVLMPDRNEVRFGLNTGNIVVYQTLFGQWSEFTGWGQYATLWTDIPGATPVTQYTFATPGGTIGYENAGVNTDLGAAFSWSIQTTNLTFGAIQGYARVAKVAFIGDNQTTVNIQAVTDYGGNTSFTDNYTWTPPTNATPAQARVWLTHQLAEAVTLTFSGIAPQSLEDLAFEVGRQRGIMRLGNAQTVGAGS